MLHNSWCPDKRPPDKFSQSGTPERGGGRLSEGGVCPTFMIVYTNCRNAAHFWASWAVSLFHEVLAVSVTLRCYCRWRVDTCSVHWTCLNA